MPLVLFFNSMFGGFPTAMESRGAHSCFFTSDRRRLAEADAVVFHLPTVEALSDVPKYPGQLWVAWSMESAVTCPMLTVGPLMAAFDLRMTYERHADIWCPYLTRSMAAIAEAPTAPKREASPAVMFQSAAYDRCGRNDYAIQLMQHLRVDSYGRFLRNRKPLRRDRGNKTKLAVIARYKFCLAFENSIAPDYVTEKFFHPLLAGTVPVYRGAPNVDDFAPGPRAFVNAADFDGPAALADHLLAVAADDAAYAEYFAWRKAGPSAAFRSLLKAVEQEAVDRLAARIAEHGARRGRGPPSRPLAWLRRAEAR